jgi:NOL1/NOP2/fmu family ribosome biogenesis protein
VPEPQRSRVLGFFETRFGIPLTAFAEHHLLERRKTYALLPAAACLAEFTSLKVHHVGLPVLRKIRQHLKPTTVALQRFGSQATRHVLELSPTQVIELLRTAELPLDVDLCPGYVVLRHAGHILGCGLYTPGRLRSQIPLRLMQHQRLPGTSAADDPG